MMKMFSRMLTAFLLEAVKSGLKMLFPPEKKQCLRVINPARPPNCGVKNKRLKMEHGGL